MALTLETPLRNALADTIDAEINTGAGTATLVIQTTASGSLASFNLQNPAFDTAGTAGGNAPGVMVLNGTPLTDATASAGTAAQFSVYDRDSTKQFEGTVGTTGGFDIQISSTSIGAGDTVQLTSFSMTVPA